MGPASWICEGNIEQNPRCQRAYDYLLGESVAPAEETEGFSSKINYPQITQSYPTSATFLPIKYPKFPSDTFPMLRLDWKLRRIAAGYRQQDIAARVGISCTRYSALERGDITAKEWECAAIEE